MWKKTEKTTINFIFKENKSNFASSKNKTIQYEINNVQYVYDDVDTSAEDDYCAILNFLKSFNKTSVKSRGFFIT